MNFDNAIIQALLTTGIITAIWMGVIVLFLTGFAITGEHFRRQRTEDPDDDWFK